jgi:hypothetical protein
MTGIAPEGARSPRVIDLETCSLARFSEAVRCVVSAIGDARHERFGARKVFISAVWAALAGIHRNAGELVTFQRRLTLATRAGLIELARADLVAAMPIDVVMASEIANRWQTFHFVIDSAARDPWTTDAGQLPDATPASPDGPSGKVIAHDPKAVG